MEQFKLFFAKQCLWWGWDARNIYVLYWSVWWTVWLIVIVSLLCWYFSLIISSPKVHIFEIIHLIPWIYGKVMSYIIIIINLCLIVFWHTFCKFFSTNFCEWLVLKIIHMEQYVNSSGNFFRKSKIILFVLPCLLFTWCSILLGGRIVDFLSIRGETSSFISYS